MEHSATGKFELLAILAPSSAREIHETRRMTRLKREASDTLEGLLRPLVLVVDDDREFRELLHAHLQASQRCRTVVVASAKQALETLRREPVTLLVSDLQMPALDGLELLEQAQREWPQVVRVLMSGGCAAPQNGRVTAWFVRKQPDMKAMVATLVGLLPE